jgi:hypothetical protein
MVKDEKIINKEIYYSQNLIDSVATKIIEKLQTK